MTVMTYQGIPCYAVEFRRTRGDESDLCTVVIPAVGFPGQLSLRPPVELALRPEPVEVDTAAIELAVTADEPIAEELELPTELKLEGTLVLAQEGIEPFVVHNLFVLRAELIESEDGDTSTDENGATTGTAIGGLQALRLTLVDERYFSARGIMPRWAFNRLHADGSVAKDSLRADGQPYDLRDVAELAVSALFRAADLSHAPGRWVHLKPEVLLPPYCPARHALRKVAAIGGAEEPCFRLDGTWALHEPGDGRIGYAKGGKGPNEHQIPRSAILSEEGTGIGFSVDAGYPDEFVLVVCSEPTVVSIALDDWEPVLMIHGRPHLLSEDLVRELTEGKYGLEWLHRWLLHAQADRGAVELPEDVVRLLDEQAYKLFRMPGVEKIGPSSGRGENPDAPPLRPEGETAGPAAPSAASQAERDRAEAAAARAQAGLEESAAAAAEGKPALRRGFYNGEPGPNAHLLPMLDRAELVGGRRLPITVEASTFTLRRSRLQSSEAGRAWIEAIQRVNEARKTAAELLSRRRQLVSVGGDGRPTAELGTLAGLINLLSPIDNGSRGRIRLPPASSYMPDGEAEWVDRQRLNGLMDELREAQRLAELDPIAGRELLDAISARVAAQDEQNGDNEGRLLLELAENLLGIERQALENRGALDTSDRLDLSDYKSHIENAFRDANGKLFADAQERVGRERSGLQPQAAGSERVYYDNAPRREDLGARVVSEAFGVVELSELAGHLANPGEPIATLTNFVPKPVRVIFGATLRPRVDVTAQGAPVESAQPGASVDRVQSELERFIQQADADGAQAQAAASGLPAEGNVVPAEALSDRETYHAMAFQRATVAEGEGEAAQTRLSAKRVEITAKVLRAARQAVLPGCRLVALDGTSPNEQALEAEALDLAVAMVGKPDKVTGARLTLDGPWPVQCDGVVAGVLIRSEEVNGAPCGFTTVVECGSSADQISGRTRTRDATGSALGNLAALPVIDALRREGLA